MPIKVKNIIIERVEGPSVLCRKPMTFESWEKARTWLYSQSDTFPKDGTYDKHDFTITFEDGKTWSGGLDCKHFTFPNNDLDVHEHVLSFCNWYAGLAVNPHCGIEKYQAFLNLPENKKEIPGYLEFIEKYL